MTDSPETKAAPSEDEHADRELFALLDRYVDSLHSHDVGSRSALLERHPELAELVGCLDELDRLAPHDGAGDETMCDPQIPADAAPQPDSVTVRDDGGPTDERLVIIEERQRFGKYELLREEGRGGMGVVYLARQTDLDRVVALKMILSSQLASEQEIRRFYQEAKSAGSIRHPNIVGIHEVGEIGGQHYFTMDYVEGKDLAALLRDGSIDPDRAAELVCQIARAVQFLHDHGLVHRDLKPSNILVDETGTAFVTDFGLAKTFGDSGEHTRTGTILGTPSYMAPEQAAGKTSQVGPRSDVYSLGAILYELLTGRPPFKQDNPLDTLVDVLEGEPTLLRKVNRCVPRDLELICLQCLEKDPQSRYSSAAALADDLERFRRCESIEARPSNVWQRVRRWSRREPALVMHLGGILAAAAVIQFRHMAVGADPEYHAAIMVRLGAWAVVSFIFQKMLNVDRLVQFTRYAWSAADVILFTSLLFVADQPVGTLLGAYALLIAASGLFFQVRLVWFTTFTALASYTALILLQPDPHEPRHYPVIFGTVLAVLGFVVAYQVYRVRVLSRYYDGRRS